MRGLDSSAEMTDAARRSDPGGTVEWLAGDIEAWSPDRPPDLVFSNAALHWLEDHDRLFPSLARAVAPGGTLAVQMPRNFGEPGHRILYEVAARPRWRERVGHLAGWNPVDPPDRYHDRLAGECSAIDIWETVYLHRLRGEDAATEWIAGAAARPFLKALGDDGAEFLTEVAEALRPHYPMRSDGITLFPFRRLFLIATR